MLVNNYPRKNRQHIIIYMNSPSFLTPTHLLLLVEPLAHSAFVKRKNLCDIENFFSNILRKILRLLQSVLWICKNCFIYNYRLFFFEKYLVGLAKTHNFADVKTLIAEKKP